MIFIIALYEGIYAIYTIENKIAESVISIIDVRNIKSQRVAEKNGLKIEKQTRWQNLDVFIYRTGSEN